MQYFKELGFETLGIDPAAIPAKEARKKGLNVIESYFSRSILDKVKEIMPIVNIMRLL
jgi:hypothetical protein